MSSPDLRRKVGQLFAVGFHGLVPSPEIKILIRDYNLGGIVLFKRNIRDAAQLQSLTLALQQEAKDAGHEHPLFIGIDQENGLVTRISPPIAAQLPGSMALGATHSPELAYRVAKGTGETLGHFGINMNYAPVCDINSEPLNPVIGVRSPGDDPEFVGRLASAAAQGLRECKIVPCIKHFPGHGDTAVDSHYGLPVIPKDRDQLELCELVPFRRCVAEGIEAVMTAHIALPGLGDEKLPATLSADALNILRKDMKYDGMVISDCLEMDGIRATYGTEQGSVLALNAGCDSIMICHTYEAQVASIGKVCEAIKSNVVPISRLEEASSRVDKLKRAFLNWDTALQHQGTEALVSINAKNSALAREAYSRSTTLVRSKPEVLPLSETGTIALILPGAEIPAGGAVDGEGLGKQGSYKATHYINILQSYNPATVEIRHGAAGLSAEQWDVVTAADVVILTTMNAAESLYQKSLGLELAKRARKVVSIAASSPYDFLEDPDIGTYITTYEPTVEAFAAAAEIIFGKSRAKGALPVGSRTATKSSITVMPFDPQNDLDQLAAIWNAALPTYALPKENLQRLLVRPNGHHFVARIGSTMAGFCIAYTTLNMGNISGQLAALVVNPSHQGKGVGTTLLAKTRSFFRTNFNLNSLALSSVFPRFWPGIPKDLPYKVQEFFLHRGFRLGAPDDRAVDLYQDIRNYEAPEDYVTRAKERGYTFSPLQSEHYEECILAQKRNFSTYGGWVEQYVELHPRDHPSSIMVAFDSRGKQVGWTLMLSPSSPILQRDWALPPLCGPKTGLIGCVGTDSAHRSQGIGLALLCHAIVNMKQRGIEGIFVDWVSLNGWYEKVGFQTWRSYRAASI
ncbi:hypothetical protein MAP00_002331 [Monascus purpureus]|nr:hypothetical protein MAP00_002331 [Monascus purpureus]